jgi:hypothetical protein
MDTPQTSPESREEEMYSNAFQEATKNLIIITLANNLKAWKVVPKQSQSINKYHQYDSTLYHKENRSGVHWSFCFCGF